MTYAPPYDEPGPDQVERDAIDLLREIGLSVHSGNVGFDGEAWHVTIYKPQRRPAIRRWNGHPVRYRIGDGQPRPFKKGGQA